jgi:peptidoglycan L-alanyl-D-glutamate endopeptidase CwlK
MDDAKFFGGLLPETAELAKKHRWRCEEHGLHIVFTSGWRSPDEQKALFQKGREYQDGIGWTVVNSHQVVTNATADHAPHCRGAAYDCAPVDDKERIDWNRLDLFVSMAKYAPTPLIWGGTWPKLKDFPHFELPNWRGLPLKET